ncbi:hypothetical protein [Streptomyces sp. NPDC093109]|uniref:hypothetical protein n=1 Tax=Streptomyces sp. NPDC093109 TaxID=3154977 RepID=UPI00344D80CD
MEFGRRAVLLGAGGLVAGAAAGCSGGSRAGAGPGARAVAATRSPVPLPTTTPWRPDRADVSPDVKLRAVQVVEAIGAWSAGQGGAAAAKRRVAALGAAPSLVDAAGALLPAAGEAALQVVDAQYGGILADSARACVGL